MSLRAIAKELEISPAYLSYIINGKRPWRKDLHQRYLGVVNTHNEYDNEICFDSAMIKAHVPVAQGIERLPSKHITPYLNSHALASNLFHIHA